MSKTQWKFINNRMIVPNKYAISSDIKFKDINDNSEPFLYKSTNGYDFVMLELNSNTIKNDERYKSRFMLFRIDLLVAYTFIPIPKSLQNKLLDVIHINGNTRDCNIDNLEWIEDVEEWRTITIPNITLNKYEVSSRGYVRKIVDKRLLTFHLNAKGYPTVSLSINKPITTNIGVHHSITKPIHRIVAYQFYGDVDLQVNHINGVKVDNNYKNLEYITNYDNGRHAIITELRKFKVNDKELDMIYSLLEKYRSTKKVYELLSKSHPHITYNMIHDIKGGRYNERVDFTKHRKLPAYRLHVDEIDMIRDVINKYNGSNSKAYNEIHDHFPYISHSIVNHIKIGKNSYKKSLKYDTSLNNGKYPYIERSKQV